MKCIDLYKTRKQIVVDRYPVNIQEIDVMFIGEAPGRSEDYSGHAFVGRSGQILNDFIKILEVKNYLITNIIKCRPPNNRIPRSDEIKNCTPYLKKQIQLLKPKIIVLLGRTAITHFFLKTKNYPLEEIVGIELFTPKHPKIRFIPFYHPAFILRNPQRRQDFLKLMKKIKDGIQCNLFAQSVQE